MEKRYTIILFFGKSLAWKNKSLCKFMKCCTLFISMPNEDREQARWNLACDMAINEQIRMAEYQLPEGAIEGENDTAENIYERIKTISFLTEGKSQKDAYIKAICADIEKNVEENVMAGDLLPYKMARNAARRTKL